MPKVKTAISLSRDLFDEVNRYSRRHGLSRSEVFAEAARRLLQEKRSRGVTQKMNRAHRSQPLDRDGRAWQEVAGQSMARLLKDDEW